MKNMVIIMPVDDWVWWCEFLNGLLKDADKIGWDSYEQGDLERIMDSLNKAVKSEFHDK